MAFYETVLIARQDISSTQVDAIVDMAQEIITDEGGTVSRREYWGLRNLAYRIKKNRKGHYILLNFDTTADQLNEMERRLRLHDDVLRFMTVRSETLPEEPSIVMTRREERDRGGRGDRGDRGDRDRGPRRDGDRGDRGGDRGPRRDDRPARGEEEAS